MSAVYAATNCASREPLRNYPVVAPETQQESSTMTVSSDATRDLFVTGLRNAHALEMQALQIMNRQVERLENYPEVEQALRKHIQETEGQRQRIDEILNQLAESPSTIKEAAMGFMGNMAAIAHAPADDEIIKNMLANHGFENYEIAAYKS